MKKNYKRILRMNNGVFPAVPASRFCKGVPGKGGKTTNYDAALNDGEIRRIIYGRKEVAANA